MDIRANLYKAIVLSGASTMFPGYASRLENEVKKLYTEKNLKNAKTKEIKIPINIIDSPRRKYSVFIGATVLSNLYNESDKQEYWITAKEWAENGEKIIKKKCANIVQ